MVFPGCICRNELTIFNLRLIRHLISRPCQGAIRMFKGIKLPTRATTVTNFYRPITSFHGCLTTPCANLMKLTQEIRRLQRRLRRRIINSARCCTIRQLICMRYTRLAIILKCLHHIKEKGLMLSPTRNVNRHRANVLINRPGGLIFPGIFRRTFLGNLHPPTCIRRRLRCLIFVRNARGFFKGKWGSMYPYQVLHRVPTHAPHPYDGYGP